MVLFIKTQICIFPLLQLRSSYEVKVAQVGQTGIVEAAAQMTCLASHMACIPSLTPVPHHREFYAST